MAHFTDGGVIERVNCMNDSREFQDIESNFCGQFSHVPSQPAVIRSPRSMLSRDKRLPLDTWNLSEPQENVLAIHALYSIHHKHLIKEFFTLRIKVPLVESQCREVQGHPSQEVKNELGAQVQCPHLHEGRRP